MIGDLESARARPSISVCVATFDGMPFVREQLASIVGQLGPEDELVVSDNGSTDGTRELLESIRDPRLRLLSFTSRRGPVPNFENALRHATREVVVLADQDDVWMEHRLDLVRAAFAGARDDLLCLVSEGERIDAEGVRIAASNLDVLRFRPGFLSNVLRNSFMGCSMAFSRRLLDIALPFPSRIPMHDSWLGILAGHFGRVETLARPSYRYRVHATNTSQRPRSLRVKLARRANLLLALTTRVARVHARRLADALRGRRGGP